MTEKISITARPLLVDAATAARMLSICRRYFLMLDTQGRIPIPIRIGKRKLWAVSELEKWVAQGCPSRSKK